MIHGAVFAVRSAEWMVSADARNLQLSSLVIRGNQWRQQIENFSGICSVTTGFSRHKPIFDSHVWGPNNRRVVGTGGMGDSIGLNVHSNIVLVRSCTNGLL